MGNCPLFDLLCLASEPSRYWWVSFSMLMYYSDLTMKLRSTGSLLTCHLGSGWFLYQFCHVHSSKGCALPPFLLFHLQPTPTRCYLTVNSDRRKTDTTESKTCFWKLSGVPAAPAHFNILETSAAKFLSGAEYLL